MIRIALVISIAFSAFSFVFGFWLAGQADAVRWIAAFAVIWLASIWFHWKRFSTLAVLLSLTVAAVGIWFGFSFNWMFSGAIFALFAWDLTEFQEKLNAMPAREDIWGRTRRRILRVSLLNLLGLVLISLLLFLRGEFTPAWGIFVTAIAALSLLQLPAWLRR